MPTAIPVTPDSMNYASVVFAGFASVSIIWYVVYARKHFTGPQLGSIEGVNQAVKDDDDDDDDGSEPK